MEILLSKLYRFLRWNWYNPRILENFDLRIYDTKYQWCYFQTYQNVIDSVFQIIYPLYHFVFIFNEYFLVKLVEDYTWEIKIMCEIWRISLFVNMKRLNYDNLNLWPFASAFSAKKMISKLICEQYFNEIHSFCSNH